MTFSFTASLTTTSIPSGTSTSTSTASCTTVAPGKHGYIPEWACNANYNYNPSFPAAIVVTAMFGTVLFIHIWQAFNYKKMKLCWTLIMGTLWEFLSFGTRIFGSLNQQINALAFVSQILVLLAPMWVNAFVYMVLGRMIYFLVPDQKVWGIKGTKIAKIFVWLDIASFLTQVGGGIMISPGADQSTLMLGIHIYMGGIGFQELCILFFASISVKFFFIMKELENKGCPPIVDGKPIKWRPLLYVMWAALVLISVRIIFRLDEFAAGIDASKNPIPFHEAYFYCLDALPMFLCILLINIVHPGHVLQGPNSEFPKGPTRKEKKAIKAAKKIEKKEMRQAKKEGREYVPLGPLTEEERLVRQFPSSPPEAMDISSPYEPHYAPSSEHDRV